MKGALQKELEGEIMAPCCYGGPVADHESDAAKQVKLQIAQLITEGKTREEVLDMYVAIYGERILASPRAQGFNVMAYWMPPIILIVGVLLVVFVINRLSVSSAKPVRVAKNNFGDEFFNKIDQEMRELDI
jgi:cytochrome c-type biogenesis protein CcmH